MYLKFDDDFNSGLRIIRKAILTEKKQVGSYDNGNNNFTQHYYFLIASLINIIYFAGNWTTKHFVIQL